MGIVPNAWPRHDTTDRTTTCGDGEEEPLRAVDLKNVEISKDPCGDPLWRVIFSHENGDF